MYLYRYGTVNMYPGNDTFIHNAVDVAIGGNSAAAIIQENKTTSDESGAVSNELANVVIYLGVQIIVDNLVHQKEDTFVNSPVKVDLDDVRSVAVGNEHMLALTKDDEVYAWGSNSNGQLGVGNITTTSSPIPVEVKKRETLAHEQFGEVYLLGAGKRFFNGCQVKR